MSKRILLMYISEVSGHHSATLAIEGAIRELDNSTNIMNVNALSYANPIGGKIIHSMYMYVIQKLPNFWGWMYDNSKVASFLEPIKHYLHNCKSYKIDKLISDFSPDVVVFSQAYPCGMLAYYKRMHGLNILLVAVLTDYAPHSYWVYDEVDFYVVPSEKARQSLIERGVSHDKIKLLGIPVLPKFCETSDRIAVCNKFGLSPNSKTILIMGGGHGLGPIDEVVCGIDNIIRQDIQMLVVLGINKKISSKLRRLQSENKFNKKVVIFDYVDNVNELMDISDIIITKAGGLTTAESLAKGLAMIVVNSIPGQEVNNMRFLVENNIAINANNVEGVITSIEALINNPDRLSEMQLRAKGFGKPNASLDIAKFILGM